MLDPIGSTFAIQPLTVLASSPGRYGDCDGDARDVNFVAIDDEYDGKRVFGSISVGSLACRITSSLNGESKIKCAPKRFPTNDPPVMPLMTNATGTRNLRIGFTPSSIRANAGGRRLYDDLGSNIDIMVVWTMAAECGMSGLAYPCTFTANTELKMLGEINLAVAVTNTAFVESGISSQLRLVHAYRHSTYTEVDTGRNGAALTTLQQDASVRAQRFLYGADLVSIVIGKCCW
jgi:hypothetical protein